MWKAKRGNRVVLGVVVGVVVALALSGVTVWVSASGAHPVTTSSTFHVTMATANDDMSIMGMAFYPSAITFHQGDTIVFSNTLPEPHTVTFGLSAPAANPNAFLKPQNLTSPGHGTYSGTGILNSGWLFPGGPFGNEFNLTVNVAPGTYTFRCALHPRMLGTITVVQSSQPLPLTDEQYQHLAERQEFLDIIHGYGYEIQSIIAAVRATDLGGSGIEIAVGGGNGVSAVMRFFFDNITIHVGETVHFVNRDPFTPHTVTFGKEPPGTPNSLHNPYGNPKAFDGSYPLNSGFLQPFLPWGMFFNVTFTAPGTYNYICGLHDTMGMVGTIIVLP